MNRNNADASQYLSRLILKSPELNATPSATAEDEAIISSILEEEDLCLWDTALAHRAAGRSFELGGILYVSPPASVFVVDDCRKQVDPADDIDSRIDLMMMDADAVVILPTELPRKTPEHPSNIASRDADRQQRFREVLDRRRRVILVRTVPARVHWWLNRAVHDSFCNDLHVDVFAEVRYGVATDIPVRRAAYE